MGFNLWKDVSPPNWIYFCSVLFYFVLLSLDQGFPCFFLIISTLSPPLVAYLRQSLSICFLFRLYCTCLFPLRLLLSSSSIFLFPFHFSTYTFFIISASSLLSPPPLCLLPSLPLFPPLSLPLTLRWRGVNMSSTCGLIVLSQQSKTTTLKLLNRLRQMTSASSLLRSFFHPSGCDA